MNIYTAQVICGLHNQRRVFMLSNECKQMSPINCAWGDCLVLKILSR